MRGRKLMPFCNFSLHGLNFTQYENFIIRSCKINYRKWQTFLVEKYNLHSLENFIAGLVMWAERKGFTVCVHWQTFADIETFGNQINAMTDRGELSWSFYVCLNMFTSDYMKYWIVWNVDGGWEISCWWFPVWQRGYAMFWKPCTFCRLWHNVLRVT